MTAAAIGILVDEGKLGWDDPVRRHIPEFEVKDPWVSREMTIRDLLTHRGGLPNTDVFWYGRDPDIAEMLVRLRAVEPAYSMRSGYTYQNVLYATAGEVVRRGLGYAVARLRGDPALRAARNGAHGSAPRADADPFQRGLPAPHRGWRNGRYRKRLGGRGGGRRLGVEFGSGDVALAADASRPAAWRRTARGS